MLIKITGIVIKQRNIGEHDRIITILSREHGIIEASAKGVKKLRSAISGATQLLCYSEFCLYQNKNYYSINSAHAINTFYNLRLDVLKLSLAIYFCDLTSFLTPSCENSWVYLRFLLNTLHFLEFDKKSVALLKSIFEFKYMALSGFMPNLVCCNNCMNYENQEMYFLPLDSTLICKNCLDKTITPPRLKYTLPPAVLHTLRHIIYADDDKIFAFELGEKSIPQLAFITENYILLHTEKQFNSLSMYKELLAGVT